MTNGEQAPLSPGMDLLVGLVAIAAGVLFIRYREWAAINLNPFRRSPVVDEDEKESLSYLISAFVVPSIWILFGAAMVIWSITRL